MKRFLTGLGVFLIMVITLLAGGSLIAVSLQRVSIDDVVRLFDSIDASRDLRVILGISGLVLGIIGFVIFQFVTLKMQREKTIAFTTPDGQVTVSLEAIGNFVRRITKNIKGIKELKPDVVASRKGLQVYARVSLWEETNIPEVSEEIQRLIRKKIQDMLGIEEKIQTRVHIVKILSRDAAAEKTEETPESFSEPITPYRDYPEV